MSDACDALVVGAGVVGVTTAYALASRGLSVTLIDAAEEPARGASYANGAQLSYVYTEALASPDLLRNLPSLALALDPAFRLTPSLDPDFARWGMAFLRNCTASRFRRNTLEGLKLGLESRSAMYRMLERHPLDFGHSVSGKLHLLKGRGMVEAAEEMVRLKRQAGAEQELISPAEALKIEPALGPRVLDLDAAVYSPQEEVGDPFVFCAALVERLRADYGVTTHFGARAERLHADGSLSSAVTADGRRIEARSIVVCTGVETPRLLRPNGIKVPIWPMKGYSLTAEPGLEAPNVSITDVARKLVFCRLSGKIRVAGLADLGSRGSAINKRRLASLVGAARSSLPRAADYSRIKSAWAGLRPMTPSSLPIIRREQNGMVLNVGHGTLGWTYAMGAAERAADLVMERPC